MAVERIDQVLLHWTQTNETRMLEQLVARLIKDKPTRELLNALLLLHGNAMLFRLAEKVLGTRDDMARDRLLRELVSIAERDPIAVVPAIRKLRYQDPESTSKSQAPSSGTAGISQHLVESSQGATAAR